MSLVLKSTGAAIALAAASLAGCANLSDSAQADSMTTEVECYGVNQCKGHNDCQTATNACKGLGACKGQGYITMPASACDHVGGTVKS